MKIIENELQVIVEQILKKNKNTLSLFLLKSSKNKVIFTVNEIQSIIKQVLKEYEEEQLNIYMKTMVS
jgi:hypothetical protein